MRPPSGRPPGAPQPAGQGPPRPRTGPPPAGPPRPRPPAEDDAVDEDDELEEPAARWMTLVSALGIGVVAVVAVEVLTAIIQGLVTNAGRMEPGGVETDLVHRLGFPFTNLGPPAALFLIVGVALLCLPGLLGKQTSPVLARLTRITLTAVVATAVVLSIGSLLAVWYLLNEYAGRGGSAPTYARVGFASFLVATLGTSALAAFGALAAMALQRRQD